MKKTKSLKNLMVAICCAFMLFASVMFSMIQNNHTVYAYTTGTYVVYAIDDAQSQAGSVYFRGWAYRKDTNNECLRFDYYVYDANETFVKAGQISKSSRPDVKQVFSNVNSTNVGFEGTIWLTSGQYRIVLYAVIVDNQKSEAIINRNFTVSNIPITFDKQNGSGGTDSTNVCYALPLKSINVPTRASYTFDGYYTEANGAGDKIYNSDGTSNVETFTIQSTNVTLYANWVPETYNITYNLDDGTNAQGNPATYTIETATITLADPTKSGYTFGGWYTENTFTNEVEEIALGSTGNKTFYAKWTQNQSGTTETWVFNNNLIGAAYGVELEANFTSNGKEYIEIIHDEEYGLVYVYDTSGEGFDIAYNDGVWEDNAYKTIVLSSEATGDLLTFLESIASKQGGGTTPSTGLYFDNTAIIVSAGVALVAGIVAVALISRKKVS